MKKNNIYFILFIAVVLTTACCYWQFSKNRKVANAASQNAQTTEQIQTTLAQNEVKDSVYFHLKYFNLLSKYIIENGKIEKVNASSRMDKPAVIEYHRLTFGNLILTVDNSTRIYFSRIGTQQKIGNVLRENDKHIRIECDNEEGKNEIYEAYNEILKEITTNNHD